MSGATPQERLRRADVLLLVAAEAVVNERRLPSFRGAMAARVFEVALDQLAEAVAERQAALQALLASLDASVAAADAQVRR